MDAAILAGLPALAATLMKSSYSEVKGIKELRGRGEVKQNVRDLALKGWKRNVGDEGWSLQDA